MKSQELPGWYFKASQSCARQRKICLQESSWISSILHQCCKCIPAKGHFSMIWENLGDEGVRGRKVQLQIECLAVDWCFQLYFYVLRRGGKKIQLSNSVCVCLSSTGACSGKESMIQLLVRADVLELASTEHSCYWICPSCLMCSDEWTNIHQCYCTNK